MPCRESVKSSEGGKKEAVSPVICRATPALTSNQELREGNPCGRTWLLGWKLSLLRSPCSVPYSLSPEQRPQDLAGCQVRGPLGLRGLLGTGQQEARSRRRRRGQKGRLGGSRRLAGPALPRLPGAQAAQAGPLCVTHPPPPYPWN